ncbi:pantoate--beta-alanine ligase [Cellulomonas oligotrophica]|uniref:Pantothenate synthetase n=1 Tax=Cellulomonas oligotrophica TaxID=931536 RepID=A0A7Y9JZT0_9CELL|nr:pantoate--beta-alanine ligase [Cellulomonas oligotrophica]NYD87139.1 pantoate--beta-alanine ligase [Cellulomonas oligotrophica]GIG32075.1 pantothenate synthetase [Cellulomonas oligotrophica]
MTTTTPALVRDRGELAAALAAQDATTMPRAEGAPDGGRRYRRAVVMTMGALHDGHLALVAEAKRLAEVVVVTIFVNPLQFGPAEDLARYPRDLDGDLRLLAGPGLLGPSDVVFAPTVDVVYPDGDPTVRVGAGALGDVLEGASRPGHLDGVLTVVLKLLHLTQPDVAVFGAKDAQQLAAVRRMVHDLDVRVDVVAHPTVREDDGLARSSRNAYLAADERARARALAAALDAGAAAADDGAGPAGVLAAARSVLDARLTPDDAVDYVALVDPATFADAGPGTERALLLLAVRVGATRLIDNATVVLRGAVAAAARTGHGDGADA